MKRIYFILLSLLLISSTAFAQKITLLAEQFETANDFAEWTNETPPNGGNAWGHTPDASQAGHDDRTNINIITHASEDNDAWIFSPGITLKAGTTYDLTFWVRLFNVQPRPRIAVGIATATNRESVISLIYDSSTDFKNPDTGEEYDYGTTWREQRVSYTPAIAGTYYIGFHGITPKKEGSPGNQDHALVDDITLEGPADNNLTLIKGFPYNYKLVPVSQNKISAKVQNTGLNAQTNVVFSAIINEGTPLTAPSVASLAPEATSEFDITSGVTFVKGANTVTYKVEQTEVDEYLDDNEAIHEFTGTDIIYATEALSGTDFTTGDLGAHSKTFGNIYKIVNPTSLTGVAAGFGYHGTYSLTFTIALYRLNGNLTVDPAPLFTKEVTRGAEAGLYTFPLDAPVQLTAGDYFLAIEGGGDGIIGTGTVKNYYEKTDNTLALSGYIGTVALRMVLQAADCNIVPVPATPVPDTYSVALAWESADAYQYKVTLTYGGEDHVYITAGKSITIENLPSETDFTWTVAALCDAIQSGSPVAGANFSTLGCPEFVSEGFEGTFPPACWTSYGANATGLLISNNQWRIAGTSTRPADITPQEGTRMIELNCYSVPNGGKGVLISPAFTHTGRLQFSFWLYRSLGDGYTDRVNIYVNTVPEIGESTPIKTVHRAINSSPEETGDPGWYQYSVIIPGEAGSKAHIIIEGISNYGYYNLYLDNLNISSYTDSSDAGVSAITAPVSGINLTDTETVTVKVKNFGTTELTNVPVRFEVNGVTSDTETVPGPIAVNGGEVSYTFTATTDLSATVTTNFTVKAYTILEGDANSSNDATTVTVTNTICNPIATFPWSEGFEGTFPPACWSSYGANADGSLNSGYQWRIAGTSTRPENITPQEGSRMIELDYYSIRKDGKGVLISPAFTHTGHLQFSFWLYRSSGNSDGHVNIYVNTVPEIGESTPIKTVHRAINSSPEETGDPGWYQYSAILPGEAGSIAYIIIEGISDYGNYNLYLDNLSINSDYVSVDDAGVSAITAPVSGINLTNAETVTVKVKNFGTTELIDVPVKFEINGGEPVAEIVPGPIAVNGGEVSYTFTAKVDLSATVTTDFTVKAYTALDADADLLNDTTTVTVTNAICPVITTFPWSEGFEAETFPPSLCWSNQGLSNQGVETPENKWVRVTTAGDITPYEGTGMIKMNCYNIPYVNGKGILTLPTITHTGHLQLSFRMHRDSYYGQEKVNVYISTTQSTTGLTPLRTINRLITDDPAESADGWYPYNVVLPGEAGTNYQIIIEGVSGYGGDILLDDLVIDDYTDSSDAGVTVITAPVSGMGLTDAETVTVTVRNFGTTELRNVPVKFEINGGEPITETIEGPIAVYGEVSYTFTAKADLSAAVTSNFTIKAYTVLENDADLSNDTTTVTVTNTICSTPISTLPWNESFEDTTFPRFCWTHTSDNNGLWKRVTSGIYPPCSSHDGSAMLQFNNYNYTSGKKGVLFTPAFSLGSNSATFSFWMYRDNYGNYGNAKDSVNIYIASAPSTTGATLLTTIYRCRDYAPVESADGWYEYKVTIPAGSGTFYIGIEGVSDYGNNTYLDDIKLISSNITVTDKSATPVAIDAPVTVTFDKEIDTNGAYDLSGITLKLEDGTGDNLATDFTVSEDKKTVTINHADLEYGAFYRVTIPADAIKGLVNISGNPGYSFTFETSPAPLVPTYDPANNAIDVAVDAPITITFNRHPNLILEGELQNPKVLSGVITIKGTDTTVESSASGDKFTDVITVTPANNLAYNTEYTVTIPAGGLIREEDYSEALTWSFKTIAALEVTELIPADNSTIDLDEITPPVFIQAQFSRAITLGDTAVIKATVNDVAYSVTRQSENTLLRIDVPEDYFEPNTTYTVVIPAGFITEIAEAITWSFTTAPALTVVAETPVADSEEVALDAEVSVEFNKEVTIASGTLPAVTITAADEVAVGNVSYSIDESGKKLVLAHDPFAYNTVYTVTIPAGILTAYSEAITWSFKTTIRESIEWVSSKPSVYPTLSKGKITVNSAPESIVSVLDVYGKTIAIYQSTGELKLDMNYANGVYLIVINDGRISTHKVILQR